VHGFRCYDNIVPNAKCQRVLVGALCLVGLFRPIATDGVAQIWTWVGSSTSWVGLEWVRLGRKFQLFMG